MPNQRRSRGVSPGFRFAHPGYLLIANWEPLWQVAAFRA
jgi:hypothetical protein